MPRSPRTHAALVSIWLVLSSVVPSVLLHASRARADDSAQRVEGLKQRGNQAMLELNYADALAAYSAAIALAPTDAALYYNLGRAHQGREDYPAALDALDQFVRRASPETRARIPRLEQLVADVRSRVGVVLVECSAEIADAVVAIGEKATQRGCTKTPKQVRVSVPSRRLALEVRLTADGYQAQSVRATVEGGGPPTAVRLVVLPRDVSVDLQRAAPITSRWWFWTGVGLVVVGAGAGVWYLVTQPETEASSGTIPPGQVSAPLVRF